MTGVITRNNGFIVFYQYPLTKGFKERAINYSIIIAVITLSFHIISIIAGHNLQTYFDIPIGADFVAFYTGGSFYNQGVLEKAYELAPEMYFPEQFKFQRDLIAEDYLGHSPFINPPYAALLYAPFAKLDYIPAYIAWIIFNVTLLFISVQVIRSELPIFQQLSLTKTFLACFLFYPTVACFLYGQATPIILMLYCLCYTFLRRGQDFKAGFCLGLLAFKPQLAIGIALVLLLKWRINALIGGALSLSASLAIGFILMPNEMSSYIDLSPRLLDFLRSPAYPTQGIDSFFGFSVFLFENINPLLTDISTYILTTITILLLLKLWWKSPWLEDMPKWDLSMAVTICWGLLISPHLFYYDLMLLLLPGAIMIQHLPRLYSQDDKILLWTTILWTICYLGSQISDAQANLLSYLELPEIALQLSTPIIFYWGYAIYKTVDKVKPMPSSP
ncbi:glycosyltransferase family 87 protein [Kiloniella majae]|uniref:glycosyltransferase family 87 protein n=1 Tax=Kiloniella majae TaxID=1938558 RepID=UPI000A278C2D|nr:glycosyltransferase family 87 protein [Kiloniella majae]